MATQLKDFDIYDPTDMNGRPGLTYGDRAIENMLIFWITSSKGDYIRQPTQGGVFQDLLFKPLRTISPGDLSNYTNLITSNFGNILTLLNFTITPIPEIKSWEIHLQWRSKLSNQVNTTLIAIDNTSPTVQKVAYLDVSLIEVNLYNFVLLKLVDMQGYRLEYSNSELSWVWGNLKLSALTELDPYFTVIQTTINGA
jgi:hypothetical protein